MIALTEQVRKIRSADDLLGKAFREQQSLSAVETYARKHAAGEIPTKSRVYSDLMPATPPRPGQQYAFEVDLDRCTSCKACVTACHNLNGLEPDEQWRSTGLLIGGSAALPFQQTVTTACHHCVVPACLNGCPVKAYEKNPTTGIVRHLDDQCIGCKYCQLTCPYDVPKYSPTKGIVRKCDMCSSRLGAGEAPACVQACPNKAIRIKIVDVAEVMERSEARAFLPGAPSPSLTMPTTSYRTTRPLPQNLLPADYHTVTKSEAHLPLVTMLVLTQLSVGAFAIGAWLGDSPWHATSATLIGIVALIVSTLHLGRPLYAYRALLGLRTSWLSREILTFGLYAFFASLYSALSWMGRDAGIMFALATLTGILGVFSSVMVYVVTGRPLWTGASTSFKFFATTLILGISLAFLVSLLTRGAVPDVLLWSVAGLTLVKLAQECFVFVHLADALHSPLRRAATLMKGTLRRVTGVRFMSGFAGCLFALLAAATHNAWLAAFSLVALVAGEVLERYLFFTTSVALRMPGGPVR